MRNFSAKQIKSPNFNNIKKRPKLAKYFHYKSFYSLLIKLFGQKKFLSRGQRQLLEVFCKNDVLKNFSNFKGKSLCQSLFLMKLQASTFINKKTLVKAFPCQILEILKTSFFTEHYLVTVPEHVPETPSSQLT